MPFLMVQLVQLPAHLMFSGTSFIVMVSVALEIKDNLKALVAKAKMNLQRNLTDDQGGL